MCATATATILFFSYSLYFVISSQFSEEDKRNVQEKVLGEVNKWMERFDCLVIGPGLGRDPFLLVLRKVTFTEFDLSMLW